MAQSNLDAKGMALVLLALVLSIVYQAPKSPGESSSSGFSLARAKASLANIAAAPRPRGSEQHSLVRAYLVRELEELGAQVTLQEGAFEPASFVSERAAAADRGAASHGRLANVVARLPGSAPTGTLLLMAHYDSVAQSPGAGDDGSGVVAVLEAMRALAASARQNDVIALFTDGEEEGLRGAQLFADEHALFGSIDVVLNFESIGNGGPALMFETGADSGGLIDLWVSTAPEPRGNTLAPVVYGWLPNDTDFSVFRDANLRGLNFAIAGGSGAYHTESDKPERFEDRALAHSAETAIALASSLAESDLMLLEGGSRSFASLPLLGAFAWRGRAHVWLAGTLVLFWALWCICRARVSAIGLARGTFNAALVACAAGLAAFGGSAAVLASVEPELPLSYDGIHLLLAVMLGCALPGATLCSVLWSARGAQRLRELLVGAPLFWIVLFAYFVRIDLEQLGASYPLAWAAACGCLASLVRLRGHGSMLAAIVLVPAILELGPILGQLVQLSSQDLGISVRMGGLLIGLGSLLVIPVLPGHGTLLASKLGNGA